MDRNEEQRYEALCAYVLGELPADERAQIEKELEGSAELRAQRDELEATIGLVRGSLTGGDELSETAAASVLARVGAESTVNEKPRFRFLRGGRNLTKVAAGLAFLTLGFAGWRAMQPYQRDAGGPFQYEGSSLDGTMLAKAELEKNARYLTSARSVGELDDRDALAKNGYNSRKDRIRGLGYLGDEESVVAPAAQVAASDAKASADKNGSIRLRRKGEQELGEQRVAAGVNFRNEADSLMVMQDPQRQQPAGEAGGTFKGPGDTVPPGGGQQVTLGTTAGYPVGGDNFVGHIRNEASVSFEAVTETPATDGSNYFIGRGSATAPPAESKEIERALRDLGYVTDEVSALPSRAVTPSSSAGNTNLGLPSTAPAGPGAAGTPSLSDGPVGGPAGPTLPASTTAGKKLRRNAVREVTGGDLARLEAGEDRFERRLGGRLAWDAETRRQYIEHECERILESCRRKPQEHPRDMYYRYWGDNPFEFTQLDPLSTFAVDVDTASYTLARNYLNKGMIPPKAQVRTEEFVNYFKPEVQAPAETTFAVHTELAPSRFGGGDANKWMLSVNVRGRDVAETERKPLRLTFVVDTSGSMKKENRMELVKHSLRLLLTKLDANDSIALVAFSQEARLILPMTSAGQKGVIESAIHPLAPDGGTNAEAGLKMGYEVALAGHHALATNRVVLLSDGVANIGQVDQDRINQDVTHHRSKGIYLNTVGVGMGNHNDVFLEQLANKGDGLCDYFDTPDEARRALVDNFTGQFEPIARDVKLQVEFDPAQVARYRLLGYENRAIADADFRNDAVDAGEVNAGHQVVALYELERMPGATADGPLATVRLRWKLPYEDASATDEAGADEATEASYLVSAARGTSFEGASFGYRRSVVVAQFAELLRRSRHARDDSLEDLIGEAQILRNQRPRDPDLMELVALLQQSRTVILNSIPACDELCRTIDEIRLKNLQVAQIQLLERDNVLVDKLQKQNIQLELTIRELLELRLQQQGR